MADDDTTATATAADDEAPTAPSANTPEQRQEASPPAEKVLTQSQVDKLIEERIARERKKYADYQDLKAKAAKHDEVVESQRSEQEKAVEAARKEGAESVLAAANARLVASEARALAAEADFRSPALAVKALDLSEVAVGDDGEVDADAIRAALKELAAAEPYLVKDDTPAPRRPRSDPSQGSGKTTDPPAGQRGRDEAARRYGNRQSATQASA